MVDLLGIGLLVVGLALIVAELTFPGYYLGVAGTVGIIVGLAQMLWPSFLTSPAVGPVAALVAVIAAMASFQFYRKFRSPIDIRGGSPGPELVGRSGTVVQTVRPHTLAGRVEIDRRLWGAESDDIIETGTAVTVDSIRSTHLFVRRQPDATSNEPGSV
jgi:membrane protein implicated in regulation of membrane protease activity